MLDKEIDAVEYKEIKTEYEAEITKLERKIEELTTLDSELKEHIAFCCELLQNLPKYFVTADLIANNKSSVRYFKKSSFFQITGIEP